jgi:uncharacterized surface protein with fasciclin (FAS1) repeats
MKNKLLIGILVIQIIILIILLTKTMPRPQEGYKMKSRSFPSEDKMNSKKDIVDVATNAKIFNTLLTAATAAGLVDTLKSDGPFTVFAPTDDAFGKLPSGMIDSLLADPMTLRDILLYHVVPGRVSAAQVVTIPSATTAEGENIIISVRNGSVFINDSKVTRADVPASNGIIHIIDSVLIPPSKRG